MCDHSRGGDLRLLCAISGAGYRFWAQGWQSHLRIILVKLINLSLSSKIVSFCIFVIRKFS